MSLSMDALKKDMNKTAIKARRVARTNDLAKGKAKITQCDADTASANAQEAARDYYTALAGSLELTDEVS